MATELTVVLRFETKDELEDFLGDVEFAWECIIVESEQEEV